MKDILKAMIFFRKKKPAPPPKPAEKPKKPQPAQKTEAKLLEIAHARVLTAEGWRRQMEKKLPSPSKKK